MRDSSEVLFALPLRLKYWFVGSSGDGIDDVDPVARRCIDCSLWNLPWLKFQGVGVDLLCRKTVVWSFSTMSECTAEVVALVLIVAKVAHTVADCS